MEYSYDYAFGNLVFTEDGSSKCPVCGGQTPNQRNLHKGEKIACNECQSEFTKEEWYPADNQLVHGARFVIYGPKFHVCYVFSGP